jgi:hypothetical protein
LARRQAILPLRTRSAISDLILIDRHPEGFSVKGFAAEIRGTYRAAESFRGAPSVTLPA